MARLAAIVLAAGASKRFGSENKLLATIDGRPLVRRVVETLAASAVDDIIVVTGCDAAAIQEAVSDLPVRFVLNDAWETGLGSSVAAGMRAISDGTDGAFVVPGDMPLLTGHLIGKLVTAFAQHESRAPVYPATSEGGQRNPVLWPRSFFAELSALEGPAGAKALLQSLGDRAVAITEDNAAQLADVDTPSDLEAAKLKSAPTKG